MPYERIVYHVGENGFEGQMVEGQLMLASPLQAMVGKLKEHFRKDKDWPDVLYESGKTEFAGSLLFIRWTEAWPDSIVQRITGEGARIVAFVPEANPIALEVVARYLGKGLIFCIMEKTFQERKEMVNECLRRIIADEKPFDSFGWNKGKPVFLSYPWSREGFRNISRVMASLGIDCRDPQRSGGGDEIRKKICRYIDSCEGVICHLGQVFGKDGNGEDRVFYNANVMFELGYATKAKRKIVLFGDEKDKDRWPSDLQGYDLQPDFDDPIEILQRIYYGLVD